MSAAMVLSCLAGMRAPILMAQRARPKVLVLRKDTDVTGTTLVPLCLGKQEWHDTLRITLKHSDFLASDALQPWPDTLNARIVRLADDIRHGVHFPQYQIIALGRQHNMVVGKMGTVFPDPESMEPSRIDAKGCMPPGVRLVGQLSRGMRLRP